LTSAIAAGLGVCTPTPGSAAAAREMPATAIARVASPASSEQASNRPRSARRRGIRASDLRSIRHSIGARAASLDWTDGASTYIGGRSRLAYIPITLPATSQTESPRNETAPDAWKRGPLRPALGEGAIHVWRADLTAVSDDLIGVLSPDERARAERVIGEHHRQLWARSRGVLRALVGSYLQQDPQTPRFVSGAHGKLALTNDRVCAPAQLSFNLSHSGGLALYAIAETGAVGVDVEVARRPIDVVAVASRAFGTAEAQRLRRLDPALREQEFLRTWTRHEAVLKCAGSGIGTAGGTSARERWTVELDVGPRAAGAVAAERRPPELHCFEVTHNQIIESLARPSMC
jgi:4'-phosphopantetheinyl transferase